MTAIENLTENLTETSTMTSQMTSKMKWVRSKDGWVAGVCQGLGDRFDIEVWILRICWVIAVCWFGTGIFVYFLLAICLPREDKLDSALDRRILGVCSRVAIRHDFEIGLVRFLAVLLALSSFGLAIFGYIVLYFAMAKPSGVIAGASKVRRENGNQDSMDSFEGARRS